MQERKIHIEVFCYKLETSWWIKQLINLQLLKTNVEWPLKWLIIQKIFQVANECTPNAIQISATHMLSRKTAVQNNKSFWTKQKLTSYILFGTGLQTKKKKYCLIYIILPPIKTQNTFWNFEKNSIKSLIHNMLLPEENYVSLMRLKSQYCYKFKQQVILLTLWIHTI